MDIGTGIAIGTLGIGATTVIVTAIKARSGNNNNGNKKGACPLHSGIDATLAYLKNSMDTVQEDIKDILQKLGG